MYFFIISSYQRPISQFFDQHTYVFHFSASQNDDMQIKKLSNQLEAEQHFSVGIS